MTAGLIATSARAQTAPAASADRFVLPKNPIAAAYVLGRLSSQELIAAPRGEFVYEALLTRAGLDRKYRMEALAGLTKIRHSTAAAELVSALSNLDEKGNGAQPLLRELGSILLQKNPDALAAVQAALRKLASDSQQPMTRQLGFAALIRAAGGLDPVWNSAATDPARLADLISAVSWFRDRQARAPFYPRIMSIVRQRGAAPQVRAAALASLPQMPGHEAEAFKFLANLLLAGTDRAAAINSLQEVPKKFWVREEVEPLVGALRSDLQKTPADQRTDDAFLNELQFANDLAGALTPEKRRDAQKALRSLGVPVIVLRTLYEQMLFDKSRIVVQAGKPAEIILQNDDAMPHNLVIVAPGALEEIGKAAEKMTPTPDASGRLYVPDSPKVLFATALVPPGEKQKLSFTAPAQAGRYQFLCSFPGHWVRMFGELAVVEDVDAYLAGHAETEAKITEWKFADLAPELSQANRARDWAQGKELFSKLACVQCHRIGGVGANYGPDLSEVFKRWNNDPANVLLQILEPSKVIQPRYRIFEFELSSGDSVSGMIVKEDGASVTVQTGPSDALIQTLSQAEIKSRKPQASSIMPVGLLNSLSKDQIFDLLAFLESGGCAAARP